MAGAARLRARCGHRRRRREDARVRRTGARRSAPPWRCSLRRAKRSPRLALTIELLALQTPHQPRSRAMSRKTGWSATATTNGDRRAACGRVRSGATYPKQRRRTCRTPRLSPEIRQKQRAGPAGHPRVPARRPRRVPVLAFGQMRAPESRSAARLLRTSTRRAEWWAANSR